MEVIPAIDLRAGRCVRLYQGDYGRETVYSEDPVEVALRWQAQGAGRIHVVDLDGAASGVRANLSVLESICRAVDVPIQVGGGIRDIASAVEVLGVGAQRIILGTAAVESPDMVAEMCGRFGQEAVVVGVDARDGMASVRGWRESSSIPTRDLVRRAAAAGAIRFVYTDISRDGTLTEPNFDALEEVLSEPGLRVIASGGIASLEHLDRLAALGAEGAILGMSLYTGAIDLAEAVSRIKAQGGAIR